MSIRTRLALAEKATGDDLVVIWINGGFSPSNHDRATAGTLEFHRADDEDPMQFRGRCEQAARQAGATCLVFGGLPSTWSN